jgi:hypothetical protein
MSAQCIECNVVREGSTWRPGEVCLFGMLFACSIECAEKWATENAARGYRPGEPGFDADITNESCGDCGAEIIGYHACQGVPGGFGDE